MVEAFTYVELLKKDEMDKEADAFSRYTLLHFEYRATNIKPTSVTIVFNSVKLLICMCITQ